MGWPAVAAPAFFSGSPSAAQTGIAVKMNATTTSANLRYFMDGHPFRVGTLVKVWLSGLSGTGVVKLGCSLQLVSGLAITHVPHALMLRGKLRDSTDFCTRSNENAGLIIRAVRVDGVRHAELNNGLYQKLPDESL